MNGAPRAGGTGESKEFSPEARAAIQARAISGTWELRKLQKLLGELSHFDETNEAAIKKARTRMILSIVATVIGFIAAIVVIGNFESAWGFLLPVAAVGLAVMFGRKLSRLKKADLIDDFRVCLRPGLRDLAQDLNPAKKIHVRMDLSGPVDRKITSRREIPPGPYMKLTETVFQDPWCEVKLPLLDGSTAVLEFEVCWKKLERRYRSRGGKIKFKTKWRKECTAAATLIPAMPVYWNEAVLRARLDPQCEKAKLVQKDGVTGAKLERYWVFKAASDPPKDAPPAREVVGLLLRLCYARGAAPGVSR